MDATVVKDQSTYDTWVENRMATAKEVDHSM